ncbi:MAG: AMP-binding protein [Acetobacteraceae bacterium]|nr:AMP-binding protein [Acetobacteraceae bacterium]
MRWEEQVGVEILDGVGSAEMPHIFLSSRPGAMCYGGFGVVVPGYEARIVDEYGREVPEGEIDELLVRGPGAAEGYRNRRKKSRRTFVGEWTYTGDKYLRDAEGYYRYQGRTDDRFKVSGIRVSLLKAEAAVASRPAVQEAMVTGCHNADGLPKAMAFVVPKDGEAGADDALFEAQREHVKAQAGPRKCPRWIEAVQDLPKTATGNILRFRLRATRKKAG